VDFIAAEELDRQTGFWWSPASDALLLERVDESPVAQWWITDRCIPSAHPRAPVPPAAGTANALVSLEIARLDGTVTPVPWDSAAYPYLVDVSWVEARRAPACGDEAGPEREVVLAVDVRDGATREVARIHDGAWVDAWHGATRWRRTGDC